MSQVSAHVGYPVEAFCDCTYACNLRCIHCNVSCLARSGRQELTSAEFADLFRQLADVGVKTITLSGGELLVRPDWEPLVEAASRLFSFKLFTNGASVRRDIATRLACLRPVEVEVSVYGATAPVYEAVTRVPGSYRWFREGLDALQSAGLRIVPKMILLRENVGEWAQVKAEFGRYEGFKADFRISPAFDGGKEPVACRPTDRQLFDFLAGSHQRRKRPRRYDKLQDRHVCGAARTGCAISAFGDIHPCGMMTLSGGNIREKTFREIWESPLFEPIRNLRLRDLPECARCPALAYCRPCPGRNVLECNDMRRPSPDSCRAARLRQLAGELRLGSAHRRRDR